MNYSENKNIYKNIQNEIKNNFELYSSIFTVKGSDNSFVLTPKVVLSNNKFNDSNIIRQYFVTNKDYEIVVLNPRNIWFREFVDDGYFKSEHHLILYSENSLVFVDSILGYRYSNIIKEQIEDNWYFVSANITID